MGKAKGGKRKRGEEPDAGASEDAPDETVEYSDEEEGGGGQDEGRRQGRSDGGSSRGGRDPEAVEV